MLDVIEYIRSTVDHGCTSFLVGCNKRRDRAVRNAIEVGEAPSTEYLGAKAELERLGGQAQRKLQSFDI